MVERTIASVNVDNLLATFLGYTMGIGLQLDLTNRTRMMIALQTYSDNPYLAALRRIGTSKKEARRAQPVGRVIKIQISVQSVPVLVRCAPDCS